MCYPKPGPRCSSHAEKEYVKRADEYRAAMSSGRLLTPLDQYTLYSKMFAAQEEYDMTPNGIQDLAQTVNSTEGEERAIAEERLERAEYSRRLRLDMMDRMVADINSRVDSDDVHQDVPEAAQGLVNTDLTLNHPPVNPPTEVFPTSYEHPELGKFNRSDHWTGNDFSYMRIEAARPISDEEMGQLAGLTGLCLEENGSRESSSSYS